MPSYSDYDADRHDGSPTYRADPESPTIVFRDGFQAKGTNEDLQAHLDGDTTHGKSGYVSTTKNAAVDDTVDIASPGEWWYKVYPQGGIDVEKYYLRTVGVGYGAYGNEAEVAVPRRIAAEDIEWAILVGPGEKLDRTRQILNPNFRPRTP